MQIDQSLKQNKFKNLIISYRAFKAAQYLFNFYTPAELHRGQVPRVIYLITNTRP